jgi:ribosomal 50S subunit-recycling heat shock protein
MAKYVEGSKIKVYGQWATIAQIVTINNKIRIYLESQICVPDVEYTKDYISESEIQEYDPT